MALGSVRSPKDVPRCGIQTAASEISFSSLNQWRLKSPSSDKMSGYINCTTSRDKVGRVWAYPSASTPNDSEESEHDTKVQVENDNSSSGRELLCSILGVVDAKVRTSNQLAQIHDTVRVKNAVEERRIKQFTGAGDVLSQRVHFLQTKHAAAESARDVSHTESLALISNMEIEEKELSDKLKRIRDDLANAKRTLGETVEVAKLARLSEKARIYFAAKESKKCGEMLTVAERNRELLSKFKAYITALTKSSTARAGHSGEIQGEGDAGQRAKVPKLEGTESERRASKRTSSNSNDSVNLMRKLSQWVEKSHTQSKESDASRTVLFSRLLYEGMRLSRHLLSKYAAGHHRRGCKDKLTGIEAAAAEEASDMDQFEKSFNMQDLYGEIPVESVAHCEVDVNSMDPQVAAVDVSIKPTVLSATVDAPSLVKPPCSEPLEVKKTVTVVLCDPRNLSHLVPRKMPERSIRIVKIMTKLTALQLALAEEKSEGVVRTQALEERSLSVEAESSAAIAYGVPEVHNDAIGKDVVMSSDALPLSAKEYDTKYGTYLDHLDHGGSYDETTPEEFSPRCDSDFYERFTPRRERLEELEIRCLARDESIALQDCFWESVALVHADEYIDHLRARARAASCFNPPYLPMKDHAITGQVEADVQFSSELNEDIPVDEADIRAAAEESGEPLPIAMLRRNARSSVRAGSCGSNQAQSYSNGHGASYDDDSDAMGSSVKSRQRSATTSCNRLSIPQNVADALLAFREEDLTEDFAPNDSDRVWMWDTMRCRRVGGYAAPFFKNLRDCLSRNSHFLVYTGQDDKDGTPPIQWDIVQWLRQAVQPSASGEVFVSSCSSSRFERAISDFHGDYEEDRTKRRKGDDSFTGGIKSKVKENGSKQLVRSGKPALLSKSKLALAVSLAKRSALGHTVGDALSEGSDVQHEVKHKINLGAFSAFRRISVWNNVRKVRVSGGNAPMKKDLKAFLEEKPEYVIWTGQRVAGADVDGDRRRVASKAKIIKKISNKLGKARPAMDSQKSRFSALSRDAMKTSATAAADKERADKDEKLDKITLSKPLHEDIFNCLSAPIRAKKEKKVFEASIFNPTPRRTGDRVRAKVLGDYSADDEEGDRDADGECEEEGRVSLWNTVKQCRVAGGNAPYRKDLQEYLLNRPEYCVYDGQEPLVPRMMKAERDALKSGRGRGRGRGGRGGRGRGGRGTSSGASASLHVGDVKSDCTADFSVLAASEPHLDPQIEFKTERLAYPVIAKVTTVCSGYSGPVKQSKVFSTALSLESKKKEKVGKTSAQILESSMASPIPLWNSRRKSCLSGRNAPIRSLLVKFLATRPEYEIYTGQDLHDNDDDELTRILALSIAGDDAPQLSYASERICMWDNVHLVKVEGEGAPMRCDLTAFIATNPERDVYINQEEMLQAERDRKTNSDSDSDESSVKRTTKGSKAKSKVAQLLAGIKLKEEVIVADTAVISGENSASEGVDDSQTEDDNASSSSSQFAAFSSSSGSGLSHYGDDEDHDDGTARHSENVPLKRGRKARAFKKGDLTMSSKSVKPLKKGHVSVWNKLRQCRVSGGNAPLRSQLSKFLATRPEYEVWVGQERNRKKKTSSEPNGADGGEGEGEDGEDGEEVDGEGESGERDGEGEKDIEGEGEGEGEGDEAHVSNIGTEDHEEEGEDDHELEEYDDVAAASSAMVLEEDQSSPPASSAVSPNCAPPSCSDQTSVLTDVPMVCVEQQADEKPTAPASLSVAEQPDAPAITIITADATATASARPEEQGSSPSMRRISRKRAMSADITVSPVPSPMRPSTPTRPATIKGSIGNDCLIAAAAKSTDSNPLMLAAPSLCTAALIEVESASNIKIEAGTSVISTVTVEVDALSNLVLPPEPTKASYPPPIEALLLPDQLSYPADMGNVTASRLNVCEVSGLVVAPDSLAKVTTDENKGYSNTASMDITRPSMPDKGFVILPSRAKRRRELANLDDPTPSASSGIFGMEAEESPSPSEDAHLINGRAVVGDRFIVHCGEGNVVSGPGWWEDLDVGASDTYISPCSFDAAVAAAAVVCAGVDAVTLGCVMGCDLLATAKANENSEHSASHAEEAGLSGLSSPIRQHHDTDIVKDKARDRTPSEDRREVFSAVGMKGPESVEVNSPLPNEGMGVEEISELMIGFLEECNSTLDNPLKEAASAVPLDTSSAMEVENLEIQPVLAAQDNESLDVVFIDKQQSCLAVEEVQSSVCDEDGKGLSRTAGTGAEGEVRDRLDDSVHEATVPPTASISTHTRSKAGLVAAAGVVTTEMLNSVAADMPVTLTEVQGVKNVFCCIRPPGHHAGRFGSTRGCSNNGFCLLNNVAIGAYYARIKYGLRRFAVVDIDAHFGNGTAEIFEGDPHAFYSSVHLQYDGPKDFFFPSSNCCILGAEERHPNRVLVNVYPPVRAGNPLSKSGKRRSRGGFRSSFEDVIIPALRTFNPDIIFISAGFDGASTDPIGGQVGLKPIDFHWMAEKIQIVADEVCGGRVVSVLEGGYDVSKAADGLATCAEAHVLALAGRDYR